MRKKELIRSRQEGEDFLSRIKSIGIVGAGESGLSLARLAKRLGKRVKLTEINRNLSSQTLKYLKELGIELELGLHTQTFLKDLDLLLLSPGVDTNYFCKNYLQDLNLPCIGEVEFSYWLCQSKNIIAITGTNGKTTTTFIVGELLKNLADREVYVLGNIGRPFSSEVLNIKEQDIVVLEISSFQLETIYSFKPFIGSLLNFSQDHLDRYPDLESYFLAKKRIFMNQDSWDYALFPRQLKEKLRDIKAKKISIEAQDNIPFIEKILEILKIEPEKLHSFLEEFKGLPHRLEFVAEKRGVKFINDSKATNVSSTAFALRVLKDRILLLAGGKDKGLDYSLIRPYLGGVRKVFLFGEAKEKIKNALEGVVFLEEAKNLEEALFLAYKSAQENDIILLSPMCSSFDMFKDYKERGEVFKRLVYELK